ncbi:MAG: hypothetical protein H8D75_00045, partial [Rhodospirillaceae bacterium]|nr:hypothetical protein [Rhodospirillaceae bacterium]
MPQLLRHVINRNGLCCLTLSAFLSVMMFWSVPADAASEKTTDKIAMANLPNSRDMVKKVSKRYPKPALYGKILPNQDYKGLTLVGAGVIGQGVASNATFFLKIKEAIDLIHSRTPYIFSLMNNVNKDGRRIIYYTGTVGPASFASWKKDYVVNISSSNIDEDPVFENTVYSLAATLVHELVGHGRQEADDRVWAMYDWCGKDSKDVKGVVRQANHKGESSGLVE